MTVADKPAGRGQQMNESAVKVAAKKHGLPILQPVSLKDEQFLSELKALNADVFVVVAFRMLPTEVWKMPKLGTFNLHASLLPDYRGAAPINWAIINGDTKTGVSTFFIDEAIDTGNVIGQTEMMISEDESAGELHDRMIETGGSLVVDTLNRIAANEVNPIPQSELGTSMRPAPKLFKENTQIDWNANPAAIHNLVRGLNPYPSAWTTWKNSKGELKNVKVFKTRITEQKGNGSIGLSSTKTQLFVDTNQKQLEILEFQVEGKKKMTSKEWLVGNNSSDWTIPLN